MVSTGKNGGSGRQSTFAFRLINPELFIKPVSILMMWCWDLLRSYWLMSFTPLLCKTKRAYTLLRMMQLIEGTVLLGQKLVYFVLILVIVHGNTHGEWSILTLYCILYHAMENTVKPNRTLPSYQSVQFNSITPNLCIVHGIDYVRLRIFTQLAEASFPFIQCAREKRPLLWVKSVCVEHVLQFLSK